MTLLRLDHVNVVTSRLPEMSGFYADVLGLPAGKRPPFNFGGAWHYCGDTAVVHLVERARGTVEGTPPVEHFAFRARDLADWQTRLAARGVESWVRPIVGGLGFSLNVHDPDGNHVEILFDPDDLPLTTPE